MASSCTLKTITDPVRRRLGTAALVGLIAGIFSAIVKSSAGRSRSLRAPRSETPPTRPSPVGDAGYVA